MNKQILSLALMATIASSCSSKKNTEAEQLQGRVKFETISIAPKLAGRILKIYVAEGDLVKKGDTLAVLDIPEISAKLQQADGALIAAQGQLDLAINGATAEQVQQIESQLKGAEEQLVFAEKSFVRVNNMYQDSLIPAQQFDETRMKMEGAKTQVNVLNARKAEVLNGARSENKKSAKGQVQKAVGAKNETLIALNEKYLLAPADMSIETIALKEGELALPGYAMFSGIKKETVYFRFTINEFKVNAYKTGQRVIVNVPNTDLKIAAKIVAVKQLARYADNTSTSPNTELGQTTYELKVIADDAVVSGSLYQNSTVLLQKLK